MKYIKYLLLLILCYFFLSSPAYALEPANHNSTNATKQLLNYLNDLPNKTNKKVISGQYVTQAQPANFPIRYDTYITDVYKKTDKWISLIGTSYYTGMVTPDWTLPGKNSVLIDHWNKGGLITLYWGPATNPWSGIVKDSTAGDFADLYTPGNSTFNRLKTEMDIKIQELKQLQDAGVVVLWRPFHEMNGNWFWWGYNNNPQKYIALWKYVFNYMKDKGLNNLLWVYAPGHYDYGGVVKPVDYYYPGDAYVDIVGVDYYSTSPNFAEVRDRSYNKLITMNKPFVLAEFGPGKGNAVPVVNIYDNAKLIQGIKLYIPKTVFFATWWGNYAIVNQNNPSGLLNDSWIISRGELPKFSNTTTTPSRILTPTSSTGCPKKSQGDANCDGLINGVDYSYWLNSQCRVNSSQSCLSSEGDFNKDGNTDDGDYKIWYDNSR